MMGQTSNPSPPAKHSIETAKNATIPNAGTTTPFKGYIVRLIHLPTLTTSSITNRQ
jgi:hypothetical protein